MRSKPPIPAALPAAPPAPAPAPAPAAPLPQPSATALPPSTASVTGLAGSGTPTASQLPAWMQEPPAPPPPAAATSATPTLLDVFGDWLMRTRSHVVNGARATALAMTTHAATSADASALPGSPKPPPRPSARPSPRATRSPRRERARSPADEGEGGKRVWDRLQRRLGERPRDRDTLLAAVSPPSTDAPTLLPKLRNGGSHARTAPPVAISPFAWLVPGLTIDNSVALRRAGVDASLDSPAPKATPKKSSPLRERERRSPSLPDSPRSAEWACEQRRARQARIAPWRAPPSLGATALSASSDLTESRSPTLQQPGDRLLDVLERVHHQLLVPTPLQLGDTAAPAAPHCDGEEPQLGSSSSLEVQPVPLRLPRPRGAVLAVTHPSPTGAFWQDDSPMGSHSFVPTRGRSPRSRDGRILGSRRIPGATCIYCENSSSPRTSGSARGSAQGS